MDLVVLAGRMGREAGWTRGIPRPLLTVRDSTLIETLISRFDTLPLTSCTICANGHSKVIRERFQATGLSRKAAVVEDGIPLGTAGCLKLCEPRLQSDVVFVVGGSVFLDDDPQWMLDVHRSQGNALTVFCTEGSESSSSGSGRPLRPVSVYCCNREVLQHIRPVGFQDLKEQLVPALQEAGLRVGAVVVRGRTREISDWNSYLEILGHEMSGEHDEANWKQLTPDVWCQEGVKIASTARIVGPAMLGAGCSIAKDAVVVGPAILGAGCSVGERSFLIRVIAPKGVRFRKGSTVMDRIVLSGAALKKTKRASAPAGKELPISDRIRDGIREIAPVVLVAAAFVWTFWATILSLGRTLWNSPDYGAGLLVPPAALYMIYSRRDRLAAIPRRFWAPGLIVFSLGLFCNLFGIGFHFASVENFGLVASAVGLIMCLVGREVFRRILYPAAFLFLMLPLPQRVHDSVLLPLQTLSASFAGTILESAGIPAERMGNVLEVAGHQIAVAEACSGLRMALAFLIVTAVVVYEVRRPNWQKMIVLLSSVPIAVLCNVGRITVSALLYRIGLDWMAEGLFHDAAGLFMVPIALGLIFLEFRFLSNLVVTSGTVAALVDQVERRRLVSGR